MTSSFPKEGHNPRCKSIIPYIAEKSKGNLVGLPVDKIKNCAIIIASDYYNLFLFALLLPDFVGNRKRWLIIAQSLWLYAIIVVRDGCTMLPAVVP